MNLNMRQSRIWKAAGKIRWSTPVQRMKWRLQRQLIAISDVLFDLRYGTETARQVYPAELNPIGPNRAHAVKYQPTVAHHFERMMGAIVPPAGSAFVDFGSGKGRVLLLASRYGFSRVTGVEFDGDLCATALRNVEIFRRRTGIDTEVRVSHLDATQYHVQEDDNIFYFSNPFRPVVMQVVLQNIVLSIVRKPRKVWLMYYCVPRENVVAGCGIFSPLTKFSFSSGAWWELPGPRRDSIIYESLPHEA